jgi:recombinational DNA repair protein (RecF pathway)
MRKLSASGLAGAEHASFAFRLLILLGFALALGACSKCDVPDFAHWGSPPASHSCDSGAPQQR